MKAIVTVRLPKNPRHVLWNKTIGLCPLNDEIICTDSTGEHHSYLAEGLNIEEIEREARMKWHHVTRVEVYE